MLNVLLFKPLYLRSYLLHVFDRNNLGNMSHQNQYSLGVNLSAQVFGSHFFGALTEQPHDEGAECEYDDESQHQSED